MHRTERVLAADKALRALRRELESLPELRPELELAALPELELLERELRAAFPELAALAAHRAQERQRAARMAEGRAALARAATASPASCTKPPPKSGQP